MKMSLGLALMVLLQTAAAQASWVKAVSCYQDAVVIDRDSSQGITQYQLVIRDGNILKRFNMLTQSKALAQNGEYAVKNGQLIEPLIPRPPHEDLFALFYSKNGISPTVGGKKFDLTVELIRGGNMKIYITHSMETASYQDSLWNLYGCTFYPTN